MRALQARATGLSIESESRGVSRVGSGAAQPPDFASLLKNSVDQIAGMQNSTASMAASYESGDKSVDLTQVMLEVQKASLAFHAMTEVRNKLVDAYTQIMAMSV